MNGVYKVKSHVGDPVPANADELTSLLRLLDRLLPCVSSCSNKGTRKPYLTDKVVTLIEDQSAACEEKSFRFVKCIPLLRVEYEYSRLQLAARRDEGRPGSGTAQSGELPDK